jgi:heptose I phosphotransferase
MTACAFGQRGKNPAKQESFIITETLENTVSLEDFCKNWKNFFPAMSLKYSLIKRVAWVSSQLHTNGINHRDYYICHFLMDIFCGIENVALKKNVKIYLIDLHRTQIRKKTPSRWIIKDVAGIWFSSMDIGLTQKDCFRFMKIYSNSSLRNTLTKNRSFWMNVNNTARRLYKKDHGKTPNIDWEKHD